MSMAFETPAKSADQVNPVEEGVEIEKLKKEHKELLSVNIGELDEDDILFFSEFRKGKARLDEAMARRDMLGELGNESQRNLADYIIETLRQRNLES